MLQGPPLLGAAVALRHSATERVGDLLLLLVANVCLMAHVFALNDWSNLAEDLADPEKADGVFTSRGVGRRRFGALVACLLVASLALFALLGAVAFAIALAIAAMGALYSLPVFDWKGRPLLNSATHVTGGILHFLLGYSLGNTFDSHGFLIATFFALTFAAGHLVQEVRDHDGDLRSGIRTNAVAFGRTRAFAASLALFTLSQGWLLALALSGLLPRALAGLAVLYPLQLRWSLAAMNSGLTQASLGRFQTRYRALYATIGLAMVMALSME